MGDFFSRDGATGSMAPTRRYDAHDAAGARPHGFEGGQTHPRRQKRENDASSCRTETSHMRPTERMGGNNARARFFGLADNRWINVERKPCS